MGVPKFCRYICERYPCVLELLSEYQIPEFDNLYLDMNGIVHCCSHPKDDDAHFRISEEDIFKNIFQYIEILFSMIKPQKLFFMAVDGVAPRAKINQQRGRRFRAAKDAEAVEARAIARGESVPKEAKFDSNCITPGTQFMSRLTEQLKYFVTWKISTNKLWQKCKIILSGPEVPGEGEHKIMDYIRHAKSQPDHDPNTRHCLYGLDADLIMLSLCTHEPHFAVLREEVKYTRSKKSQSIEKTRFCLFHISLLREYMEHEFSAIKEKLNFPFDLEKIIDDWILMGFLVGNDFIPNLPNLQIENDALPILYRAYMDVLPTLDGYINEAGDLKLDRFEKFMGRLSQNDTDRFAEHFADLKYFQAKTGRRPNETERTSYRKTNDSPESSSSSPYKSANKELSALIKSTDDMLIGHSDEEEPLGTDSDTEMYQIEFLQHKRDYYMNKLEFEDVNAEVLRSQAEAYVTAIQWNLHYYYNGCCSWSWYYPHHYAPYVSDIKGFKDMDIKFEKAKPFLPFQQLLAVLPAASKALLPPAYQGLLTNENSPIIDYYPEDFKTDLNQKKHEWEAIVLIPFIDEKRLLDAMEPYNDKLTDEEKKRNSHGPMSIISYTDEDLGLYEAPQYFPTIRSHAKVEKINREDLDVPIEKLVKGLMKSVKLSVYFAGFPTLQHIDHTAKLDKAKVRVFEQPSRYDNMIVSLVTNENTDLRDVACKVLGKTVFVSWPHMREARVIGVSTADRKIVLINTKEGYTPENTRIDDLNSNLTSLWHTQRSSVTEGYKSRFGIDIGNTSILIYALPMIGRQYILTTQGKMSLEKTWSEMPIPYAYQAVVTDIATHDPGYKLHQDITEVFAPNTIVFMLGHPHYGAMGEVIDNGLNVKNGRVKVAMSIVNEPNLESIKKEFADSEAQWMSTSIAAQRLGLGNHFLSRITGSIFVAPGSGDTTENFKQNVGLNLKFTKRNEEVPGYTKRPSGQWLYSAKSIGLIRSYMENYPVMFERLARLTSNDHYVENDLFEGTEKLSDVVNWLKEQPFASLDTRSCNSLGIYGDTIEKIKKFVESTSTEGGKTVIMQVKPHLLLKPGLNTGNVPPDPKARHKLFDRVINVKECSIVPLGYKGTIVEIIYNEEATETVYDVLFDKDFVGDITLNGTTTDRRYRLHCAEFINLSHGTRVEQDKTSATVAFGAPSGPAPPKSWRQDTTTTSKKPQSNLPYLNPKNIPLPRFAQNNKSSDYSDHHQQQQTQQSHGQQIRVMKKNDNQGKRSGQTSEEQKKSKTIQQKAKSQIFSNDPGISDTITSTTSSSSVVTSNNTRVEQKNSEFQMLWNELQKPSSATTTANVFNHHKTMMNPPMIPQQHSQILSSTTTDPLQEKSAILKAMLKIPDENSSVASSSSSSTCKPIGAPAVSNVSTAPPLVQQLFDHAREASRKNNVSYCAMLLTHSQLTGRGMPRYNYVTNPHKMVSAQILLPDMRTYCGEFCINHVEAAESAAKVVCKELKLESVPKPGISILGATPAMWHNPRPNNVQQPQLHNARPMMPPGSPQIFPNMHNPPMHMPQWNPRMQRPAPFPQHQLPNVDHNRPIMNSNHPIAPPQPPPEIPKTDNKPDNKKNKNTPFVPLQAQKKTRNSKPKQTSRNQNSGNKETNQQPQASQIKPRDDPPKMSKDEKITTNEKKDSESKKPPQLVQKVQRAPKPRRSRIAANFNSASAPANGSGPPQ